MTGSTVQFRFLQVVANPVADERVTVGLLHWDGADLRVAVNPSRVPDSIPSRSALSSLLRSLRRTVLDRAIGLNLPLSLDALSPVPLGETGLLSWSALRVGTSSNAQAHFEHLRDALGLRARTKPATDTFEPAFEKFAENVVKTIQRPDVLRVKNELTGLVKHVSPLSWKNGAWHHTFAVGAQSSETAAGFGRRLASTLGRIDASVAANEIGVLVVGVDAAETSTLEHFEKAREHIQKNLAGRVDAIPARVAPDAPADFSELYARVQHDISSAV